jgi:hypothetical protein
MRLAGKQKLGYFPLPLAEAERIRRFLQFPLSGYAALDPCIGDGGAFKVIAGIGRHAPSRLCSFCTP